MTKGEREQVIHDAWKAVEARGGHPDAEPHRARAETATRRVAALLALAQVPAGEDEATDRAYAKAWSAAAAALDGCTEADAFIARTKAVKGRAQRLNDLKRAIDAADHGTGPEKAVIEAAQALPPGYGAGLNDRVRIARERIAASAALDSALAARPQSDLAIASAAERARADGTWPADPVVASRCELAIRRRNLLLSLGGISTALPLDEQDAQLAAAWDNALLADCHDARDLGRRHADAVARITAFATLEAALEQGDAVTVKRLARDPRLADHPGLVRLRVRLEALIAKSEQVERLLAACRAGRADAFLAEADPALLAAHASLFVPFRPAIETWVAERLRKGDVLGMASPPFLRGPNPSTIVARWVWPQSQLVRLCLIASDPLRFFDKPEDAHNGTQLFTPDTQRLAGGATLSPPNGYRKVHVTIWPVVDLGWTRVTGPPLCVGPYLVSQGEPGRKPEKPGSRTWSAKFQSLMERLLNS